MTCSLFSQTAGQSVINKKNVGAGYTLEATTLPNSSVLGRSAAGSLTSYNISSGGNGVSDNGKIAIFGATGYLKATKELSIIRPSALVPAILKLENGDGGRIEMHYDDGGITDQQLILKAGTMLVEGGSGSSLTNLNASNISSGELSLARIGQNSATSGQALAWNGTAWSPATITGASPSGSGSELQYRSGASTFGAVTGSSVSGGAVTLGGVLGLTAGSAAAPALHFGDADTGLYSGGADMLAFATGGVQRASVGVSGGVGTFTLVTPSSVAVYSASGGGAQLGTHSVNASLTPYWTVTATSGNFSSSNRAYLFSLGGDVTVAGDAADIWAHRRGTNNQTVRVYEVDNSGDNDEYLEIKGAGATNYIKPVATGTGTASTVRYYTATTVWFGSGSGSPEGVETAGIGSLYADTATGTLYRKTSGTGNTGWVTP